MKESHLEAGFTLIELLVVISIIGLLSSIVLAGLNGARMRAKDSLIKQELIQFANEAEIAYATAGSYDNICNPTSKSYELFNLAWGNSPKQSGEAICSSSAQAFVYVNIGNNLLYITGFGTAEPNKWAVSIRMNNGNYFCMDGQGIRREQATLGIGQATDRDCN